MKKPQSFRFVSADADKVWRRSDPMTQLITHVTWALLDVATSSGLSFLQYPHRPPFARINMADDKTAALRKQLKIKAGVVKRWV